MSIAHKLSPTDVSFGGKANNKFILDPSPLLITLQHRQTISITHETERVRGARERAQGKKVLECHLHEA
jgi:hypothetical protein